MPLADVLTRIDASVEPVAPRELNVGDALGRTLAADVHAGPHPRVPLALRDGYAVSSEETSDAGSYAPAPLSLAVRADVGAPLPSGTDAVAPLDAIDGSARPPQALAPITPGEGVLPCGQDADPGEPLLSSGTALRHVDLAILAALGIAQVPVRAPTVRVISVRRDPIARAITTMLIGSITSAASVDTSERSVDGALRAPQADLIVVVGGSGSGEGDDSVRVARAFRSPPGTWDRAEPGRNLRIRSDRRCAGADRAGPARCGIGGLARDRRAHPTFAISINRNACDARCHACAQDRVHCGPRRVCAGAGGE